MALEQEARVAFNAPATWSNRSAVTTLAPNLVRIAFAEVAPGETKAFQYHTALMMTYEVAAGLRDALTKELQNLDKHRARD